MNFAAFAEAWSSGETPEAALIYAKKIELRALCWPINGNRWQFKLGKGWRMNIPVGEVPSATDMRFDVYYSKNGCSIEPHFCREWDENGGCYGTNLDHGYSFEEACDQVAEYHEQQAKLWRERQHHTCLYYLDNGDTDD